MKDFLDIYVILIILLTNPPSSLNSVYIPIFSDLFLMVGDWGEGNLHPFDILSPPQG